MSEMVEKVAGAIETALNADRSLSGTESRRAARAAIKAMQELNGHAVLAAAEIIVKDRELPIPTC